MLHLIKIFESNSENLHQSFEWNSGEYKKLKAVFCAPEVQLSLAFDNGKKIAIRSFENNMAECAPNDRNIKIEKDLDQEIISGVISKTEQHQGPLSVYLILEK